MSNHAEIILENICFSYEGPVILENITLTIRHGEFIGLVGPNGGGKSTLLKIILGLLEPERGKVWIGGKPPRQNLGLLGYVPQYAAFSRDFPISVKNTVLLGRLGRSSRLGRYSREDHEIAGQSLREAGMEHLADRPIARLSGGQLQRVLIARALAGRPDILLLDEPTSNIDMRAESEIFDLLGELNARMTIVVVSHDIGFISRYVTRVACLNRTLMCHQAERLSGNLIEQLYGMPIQAIQHRHS